MRRVPAFTICLALATLVVATVAAHAIEPQEAKIQAVIEFDSMGEWDRFISRGDIDLMKAKPGEVAVFVTDAAELGELRADGFDVRVLIDNMQEHYARRIRGDNFGDFHTYSETIDFLDALHAAYPTITTARDSIGGTEEGRALWAMKISDNPSVNESEPEVFIDGLHHAREPITVEAIMHYMSWLCENYGTDPEATFLVDNREIWFLPIVNPDGYCYNETAYPSGGGMWRKNRRDNEGSSCYGVDPNRNYPFQWGTIGMSSNPCDDLFRGPSAGSEPEVQAYMDFVAAREIVTSISFHSVVGCILIPWGYTVSEQTPDDEAFRYIGGEMAKYNGYDVGQAGEMISYVCGGTTTDWIYATHDIWAVCIEVGGSDFWPLESEIPGLRGENLWPQRYITRIAGLYVAVDDCTVAGGDGDGVPESGETVYLFVTLANQSVAQAVENVSIEISTDDPYVQLLDADAPVGTIASLGTGENTGEPLMFTIDPSTPDGHGLVLNLSITADGFSAEEELVWLIGSPPPIFADDMEGGTSNWVESDGEWGLTTAQYHSSGNSYTDSPSGSYGNYANTWIELASSIDLSTAAAAELRFWHLVDTEASYDYCYVEGSDDGGTTWYQIGPRYDGAQGWQEEELSLAEFVGTSDFKVRFRFNSDTYVVEDGWYIDDVEIVGPIPGNTRPTAPTLSVPLNGDTVGTATPTLTVTNAVDTDGGDILTYGFRVYGDEDCTSIAAQTAGVAEGAGATSWTVGAALSDGDYWWRAYADDGTERGPLMIAGSFTVDSTGIGDEPIAMLKLHPSRPNPFSGRSVLSFDLPVRGDVTLAVYSLDGRLVRTVVSGTRGPGRVEETWDGRDGDGHRVGNGLYFLKLEAGGETRRGKIAVLR